MLHATMSDFARSLFDKVYVSIHADIYLHVALHILSIFLVRKQLPDNNDMKFKYVCMYHIRIQISR